MTEHLLKMDHGFSIIEQENMLPYEKEIHLNFIQQRIKDNQQQNIGSDLYDPLGRYKNE